MSTKSWRQRWAGFSVTMSWELMAMFSTGKLLVLVSVALSCLGGCSASKNVRSSAVGEQMAAIYREHRPQQTEQQEEQSPRVTLDVVEMPAGALCRVLALRYGISIVLAADLEPRPITLAVTDRSLTEALSLIARKLGVGVSGNQGLYYLGQLRPQDLAVLVRRVRRLSPEECSSVVAVVAGETRSAPFVGVDGLLVLADEFEIVRRVSNMLDQVEHADTCTWVVQLYLVDLLDSDLSDFGLNTTPAVEVSAALAGASQGLATPQGIASGLAAGAKLDTVLQAVATMDRNKMVADPLFLLCDGTESTMTRGQSLRVRTQSVSTGTGVATTSTGIQTIQLGLTVKVSPKEISPDALRLKVEVGLQDLVNYVDGLPTTSNQQWGGTADLQSGGTYLLASLRRDSVKKSVASALRIGSKTNKEGSTLLVWGRAYRVRGPAPGGTREAGGAGAGPLCELPKGHSLGDAESN